MPELGFENEKLGSIPYRRQSQWDVPTNTPLVNYIPMWQANGTLLWVPQSSIDHGSTGGLGDDDHTQYLLLAGRAAAQQDIVKAITVSTYARVGSNTAPTNTTAGHVTAEAIWVPNQASSALTGLINAYSNDSTLLFIARVDSGVPLGSPAFRAQGAAKPPIFAGLRSAGTIASPSAVLNGNVLVALNGYGFYDTTNITGPRASLQMYANENWSSTASGTYAALGLTPNGSTVNTETHIWTPDAYAVTGYLDASVGYRKGGLAPSGQYIRGDGTNGVFSAIQVADVPTLTSAKISDFTEAAQDAAGAMAANSSKVTLTYADATPSLTADIVAGSLGPADIANRTRKIPLYLASVSGAGASITTDTHGSLGQFSHSDYTDGNEGTAFFAPVPLPSDFVSGLTFNLSFSSSVGGNNVKMRIALYYMAGSGGAGISGVYESTAGRAAHASANTSQLLTLTGGGSPPAGSILQCFVVFGRSDGAVDTNTGTVSLWNCYLEYTADS